MSLEDVRNDMRMRQTMKIRFDRSETSEMRLVKRMD